MRADVEQSDGTYRSEERGEPVCGEDFCDACGDCLHCDADAACLYGEHRWVIYLEVASPATGAGEEGK